jgi:hypothetical protein
MNPDEPYCFLVSSFADDERLKDARENGIQPATATFGFPTYRIDEMPLSGLVVSKTREYIAGAYFVIADLTGQRPNCYYEVGYAHALERPVVHIIHASEEPQFNVAGLHFLRYANGPDLRVQLERYILTHVLSTHGSSDPEDKNKGAYGRRAFVDPFLVTARVQLDDEVEDDPDDSSLIFVMDARVRSVDPRRPLTGKVTFHLHEDCDPPTRNRMSKHGIAEIKDVYTFGCFTLGVTLHDSQTRLELDLERVPGAGPDFRRR